MSRPLSIRRPHDRRVLPEDRIRNTEDLKDVINDLLAVLAEHDNGSMHRVDPLIMRIHLAWPGFSRA